MSARLAESSSSAQEMQSIAEHEGSNSLVWECQRASEIVQAYYDPTDSCPVSIRRIVNRVKDLNDILEESVDILLSIRRSYPGQRCLRGRLTETEHFIKKFCKIRVAAIESSADSPPRPQYTWSAPQLAFEQRKAEKLLESLQLEAKKFVQFLFVLCLHTKIAHPSSLTVHHSGRLEPAASSVQAITRRLSELTYQVERRQTQAAQNDTDKGKTINMTDLEHQVQREWLLLCLRAGLDDSATQPPLPASARSLLLSPAQIYHEMIIAHHRDTTARPLSSSFTSFTLVDSDSSYLLAPSNRRSGPASVAPDDLNHHDMLGEPALPLHVASFEIRPRQMLKLQSWRISSVGRYKKMTWIGIKGSNILEHSVDAAAMPYTMHSSLQDLEKQSSLTFQAPSRVVWRKEGKQKLNETRTDVTYGFVNADDSRRFQEDWRDMDLVEVVDAESVRTCWSKGRLEAVNQDIKIWRSRDDNTYSMSFFANHLQEHLEFPLDWFTGGIEFSRAKSTVTLHLIAQGRSSWRSSIRGRLSRPSSVRNSETVGDGAGWTSVGSPASSVRGSISTTSSSGSSIGKFARRIADMAAWADKFRDITIQFEAVSGAGPARTSDRGDHFDRFCQVVQQIMGANSEFT